MPLTVEKFSEKHLDDVIRISSEELGELYQKPKMFLSDLENPNVCNLVALDNGKVVGFCRSVLFGPEKIDEILKIPDSEEKKMLSKFKKIVLIDSVSVTSAVHGKGIGTLLTQKSMNCLKGDIYVGMLWKSTKGHINAEKLFNNLDFTETSLEIKGYWNLMVEEPEGHHCPYCGAPCKCSAVLYYRKNRTAF